MNAGSCAAAWALTRQADPGRPIRRDRDALRALLVSGSLPRPRARRGPSSFGLRHHDVWIPEQRSGLRLSAWYVPHPSPRAIVAVFHGHMAEKSALLPEAAQLHRLGCSVLLVDFRGSGDSTGDSTTIGYHEADDVVAAATFARELEPGTPLVLYGVSMGAAAVTRAAAVLGAPADALVLEAPFTTLMDAVERRLRRRGLPSQPASAFLVGWGSVMRGFNGFGHAPLQYATRLRMPVLLVAGDRDPWVPVADSRRIYEALGGRRELLLCRGVGHFPCGRRRPAEWGAAVGRLLDTVTPEAGGT